jgi:predicted Zn-dependent protease
MVETNRPDDALPLFQQALEIDPDNVNIYVQLGRAEHAKKNFKETRAALEEAIQINPFNPLIYRLLGDAYAALGDQEKARAARTTLERLSASRN